MLDRRAWVATCGFVSVALVVASWAGCSGSEQSSSVGLGGAGGALPGLDPAVAVPSPLDVVLSTEPFARALHQDASLQRRDGQIVLGTPSNRPGRLVASAPTLANGPIHLGSARAADQGAWLEVTPVGRSDAAANVERGSVVYRDVAQLTDVVVIIGPERIEELRVLRGPMARTEARYELSKGGSVQEIRERDGIIEALDDSGHVAFRTEPAFAVDAAGQRREIFLRLDGTKLVVSFDPTGLVYPVVVDPAWMYGSYWPDDAVVALNSVLLGSHSETTGDVAVIDASAGPVLGNGAELELEAQSTVTGSVSADTIRLGNKSRITGSAAFNSLWQHPHAVVDGAKLTPLTLPLPTTIPAFPSFSAGSQNFTVPSGAVRVLAAGAYHDVSVHAGSKKHSAVLRLPGGLYELATLQVGEYGRVECDDTCELRVKERVEADEHTYLGPSKDAAIGSPDVELFVVGDDGHHDHGGHGERCQDEKGAVFGPNATLVGRVFVPNGTLWLKEDSTATGRLVARDVELGAHANVVEDQGAVEPDCTAYCQKLIAAGCSGGPTDQASCEAQCQASMTTGDCTEQWSAVVLCTVMNGTVTCDGSGQPLIAGCTTEDADLAECETVCAGTDDQNPCTIDACNCTLASCDPQTALTHTPVASGTSCSDGNVCNGSEICNGAGICVAGTPLVLDDGNPCTTDACDPLAGVSHVPAPQGTSCTDGNACNGDETCNASSNCVAGTPPTIDDGNPCTVDSCEPATGVHHIPAAAGTACPDGNRCNGDETCDGSGTCRPGTAPTVDDGHPCTVDNCDPATGVHHTPAAAGTPCPDGNACNGDETCDGSGTCRPGTPPTLDDGNPCTMDACDPVTGMHHTPAAAGTSCSDGNVCDGDEKCDAAGHCQPGTPPQVDDGNPCTVDTCDPVTGVHHMPAATGSPCPDGNACNGDETCDANGHCQAGTPPTLDDGNPCTADTCDPVTGVHHVPVPSGTSCSDGNACNGAEICNGAGTCHSGTPPTIDDGNPCTIDSCDPGTGVHHVPAPAGTSCSDGNACNGDEKCDGAGTCSAGSPPVVDDGNPCTVDSCDPATGVHHIPAAAGTPCPDGNACNGAEICSGPGTCVAGTPPVVDDGNPCTIDSCDSVVGVVHSPAPAGTACLDGNVCNGAETCNGGGICAPGTPLAVDDGNPCTVDSCDPVTGVMHSPSAAGTPCPNGDLCDGDEVCNGAGTCMAGTPPAIDDGNPCTADTCDPALGVLHLPLVVGTSCSDGNVCNGIETCDGVGTCVAGMPPVLDDGNPCTADSCDPVGGVAHAPVPAGTSCSDGNACNGEEMCNASAGCEPGTPPEVDDGNACTDDSCDPVAGVTHPPLPVGSSCSDGDVCNGQEICDGAGTCLPGVPLVTDDGDDCSIDICDPVIGVRHSLCTQIDRTVASTLYAATSFLFTGANAVQTGVASGAIDPLRVSVLRGRVKATDGTPLSGVNVRALRQNAAEPDYGHTFTGSGGEFYLAVNGGGVVTLVFEKQGYLPVARPVGAQRQDYSWVSDDVVLTRIDANVSTVELASATDVEVASGSVVTDSSGPRQARIMFDPGTTASAVLPNGSAVPLDTMHLRLTEFTVGDSGPQAMPAPLPPTSAYTYAVEITADEALELGAKRIDLSEPVSLYVDNFVGFDVGTYIPVGYYDRDLGQWIPMPNGIVVRLLDIVDGAAEIDIDDDGVPEPQADLDLLHISVGERQRLAGMFAPGQSFWWIPLGHFSVVDANHQPGRLPDDCVPAEDPCKLPYDPHGKSDPDSDRQCSTPGSSISCQSQAVGEQVPVAGTPFSLHYQSNRTAGYAQNSLEIPLTGGNVPPSVRAVAYRVSIAGTTATQWFDCTQAAPECTPNSEAQYTWNGRDAVGRLLQGPQDATVQVGYAYPWPRYDVYKRGGGSGGGGSGSASQTLVLVPPTFGRWPAGTDLELDEGPPMRGVYQVWSKPWHVPIGTWQELPRGLGGWSLSVHDAYSAQVQAFYRGDGTRRGATGLGPVVEIVAGGVPCCNLGDGGPAKQAWLGGLDTLVAGPDGLIYLAGGGRVRRIDRHGIITTVAGTGSMGYSGDGGPATQAKLYAPHGLALGADGSLYIADEANYRVRRVGPDGIITTVAGTGTAGFSGDGGPASAAKLSRPEGVAIGPDGSLYIADMSNRRVRHVALGASGVPNGIIRTIAGGGANHVTALPGGGHRKATDMFLGYVSAVTVRADGSVYVAEAGWEVPGSVFIDLVALDGTLRRVAGDEASGGQYGDSGDGQQADHALITYPSAMAAAPDGSLSFSARGGRIRRVGSDGIITRVTGSPPVSCAGAACFENQPALAAYYPNTYIGGVALGPDGALYFTFSGWLLSVVSPLPGAAIGDVLMPSEQGGTAGVFSASGRHLSTRDTLLGTTLFAFGYDPAGRLHTVTDVDGRTTTIEHDQTGNPTRIVGPYGQQTTFSVDPNGYLASITNPAGESYAMTYHSAGGLLATFTDPKGHAHRFAYDEDGRLIRASDPPEAGGFKTLGLVQGDTGPAYAVGLTTALGRTSHFAYAPISTGGDRFTNAFPDGTSAVVDYTPDGKRLVTYADGSTLAVTGGPDPRFGMLSPVAQSVSWHTDAKTLGITATRTVTQTDPNNPFSLTKQQDKVTVNGKLFTTTFDKTVNPPTVTRTTAAGRSTVTELDPRGRATKITVQSTLGLLPVNLSYYGSGPYAGKLQSIVQGTGSTERRYTLSYDSSGKLGSIAAPLGKTVSYGYDPVGRVTAKVLPDGSRVRFSYDANGNVSTVLQPGSSLLPAPSDVHQLDHGPLDFLSSYAPPDIGLSNGTTSFQYTADRELGLVTRPDGLTITPVYDSAGRLAELDVPGGSVAYTYFPSNDSTRPGKPQSVTSSLDGVTVSYGWSGTLPVSTIWSGTVTGSVTRAYDNDLRLTTETVGADAATYVYGDADGLLTQAGGLTLSLDAKTALLLGTTLARVTDSLAYNGFAEPASYEAHWLDPGNNPVSLYSMSYVRDAFGRIIRKTDAVSGGTAVVHEYAYDDVGRLTDVLEGAQPCDQGPCANIGHYGYDANGNRTSYDAGTGPMDASYDAQDRLLTYGQNAYSYTANGELTEKNAGGVITTYGYDVLGNLRIVHLPDSRTIDYVIDGLGRRVGKKVDGALQRGWLYRNGLSPVAELGPDGQTLVARFVYGTRGHVPDYMVKGGSTYRIITDHLGSVRLVVDATTGTIAQEMSYDEFGRVLQDTNPGFQPFGFAGGLYDPDTGLVRFGARDYDAEVGRWTSKDPSLFRGGVNLYSRTYGDPINFIDVDGRNPIAIIVIAGMALSAPFLVSNSDDWSGHYWMTIAGMSAGVGIGAAMEVGPFIGGLASGLAAKIQSCGGGSGTTKLFRAVSQAELDDMIGSGGFRNPAGLESKYFSTTLEGAQSYAQQASRAFGDGPFTIVETAIPSNLVSAEMTVTVDQGISTVVLPTELLPSLSAPTIIP